MTVCSCNLRLPADAAVIRTGIRTGDAEGKSSANFSTQLGSVTTEAVCDWRDTGNFPLTRLIDAARVLHIPCRATKQTPAFQAI